VPNWLPVSGAVEADVVSDGDEVEFRLSATSSGSNA
jgi:hypothetical protein